METSLRLEENIRGMISNLPGDVAERFVLYVLEGDLVRQS